MTGWDSDELPTVEHQGTTYPPELSPVQAWLLGFIDLPTLRDTAASMGEASTDVLAAYGRAITDEGYAATLVEQAQERLQAYEQQAERSAEPDVEAER